MSTILITGGTGTLGHALEAALPAGGARLRILSRRQAPPGRDPDTWVRGDLGSGGGLDRAVRGVDAIIHCATNSRGGDAELTRRLVDAALRADVPPHLVYISIVGIDRIPLGYYREKLATERVIETSGLPWTILRATQFHTLAFALFSAQRRLPLVFAPSIRFQSIDVRDVATHLLGYASGEPAGHAPDIGGPQVLPAGEIARATLGALGVRRPVVPLRLPGRLFAALRAGHNLVPGSPAGTITFADFLTALPPLPR